MNTNTNINYYYYYNNKEIKILIGQKWCQYILPTINLLKSSLLVSISGSLRIYIASLLMLTEVNLINCFGGGLIIYAVYTLDRILDSPEDSINKSELKGSNKKICFVFFLITFIIGCYILNNAGLLFVAFLPFITGYLYSKGLKIGNHTLKLKSGLGIKNIVVGITWGVFLASIAGIGCESYVTMFLILIYYSSKLFINSAIYDFKDVKGDLIAGIKTLPVILGIEKTRYMLLILHFIAHIILFISILKNVIAFEPTILMYSFLSGILYICILTQKKGNETNTEKIRRLFLIDGESTSILLIRSILGV